MPAEACQIEAGSNLNDRARVIVDDHAGDALAALRTSSPMHIFYAISLKPRPC